MWKRRLRYLLKVTVLLAVYFITARVGLSLDAVSGFAALVWPPTGIALAVLIIFGFDLWPGIALAAFLVNWTTGAPLVAAIGIGMGNTLEAVLGAYLVGHVIDFRPSLERIKDVLGLIGLAAVGSTLVSATIGVSSLLLAGTVRPATYGRTWLAWWVGDMLGVLVVAPLLLVWSQRPTIEKKHLGEIAVLTNLLVGMSILIFWGIGWLGIPAFAFAFPIFPILVWIALRFGQPGAVTATSLVLLIAIWATVAGSGPFARPGLSHGLLLLQSFIGVTALTFMVMAAVVSERLETAKVQQKLMQRTIALSRQRKRLLALNQAKDEFISLASHQLRTPATGVKQYVGMVLESYAGALTPDQRRLLRLAYDCNEREIQIVNDLLKVAQVDAGKVVLKKQQVNLRTMISEIIQDQHSIFAMRRQSVQFTPSSKRSTILVDKDKMRMVLENIIENASKYTPDGQSITIQLNNHKNEQVINIIDTGIGIAKQDIGKLFKKFSRVSMALTHAVDGNGLGLYWSKKIVDLHQGSITVSSKPNQGSTFTITLPNPATVAIKSA
ncbi:MAG: hypothetical protein JWS12_353 [Candidatus Saccharibacteria bacterium]|nr:hypothetical protein [Candidatus Saccharibacteria bacterium]